jgi:hypothetical protein
MIIELCIFYSSLTFNLFSLPYFHFPISSFLFSLFYFSRQGCLWYDFSLFICTPVRVKGKSRFHQFTMKPAFPYIE